MTIQSTTTIVLLWPQTRERDECVERLIQSGYEVRLARSIDEYLDLKAGRPFSAAVVVFSLVQGQWQSLLTTHGPAEAIPKMVWLLTSEELQKTQGNLPGQYLPYEPVCKDSRWLLPALDHLNEYTEVEDENQALNQRLDALLAESVPGETESVKQLRLDALQMIYKSDPILICGESGTDSRRFAQGLHQVSSRHAEPLLITSCTSRQGLEEDLFGDEGLSIRGKLSELGRGTLVLLDLDEIEPRMIGPIFDWWQSSSTALIATSHLEPDRIPAWSYFNEQLGRVPEARVLRMVPIRDQILDLPIISNGYLHDLANEMNEGTRTIDAGAFELLTQYSWPGNHRELKQVLRQVLANHTESMIREDQIVPWIGANLKEEALESGVTLELMERRLIEATFTRCGGNRELTAKTLQIGVRTLCGKLRSYGYPPRGGPGSNIIVKEVKAA